MLWSLQGLPDRALDATDPLSEEPVLSVRHLDSHDLMRRKTQLDFLTLAMCTNIKYVTLVSSCSLQFNTALRSMYRKEIEKIDN